MKQQKIEKKKAENTERPQFQWKDIFNISVIVASLGYFVDIYDLVLFSIVRIPSLTSIGLSGEDLTTKGVLLLNTQMGGMLIGGILWGILGDKRGRLSVLFGSILLYSIANFANGMVTNIETYVACRFIAGIGLAGELGAGITLVSEILPVHSRGYGTMVVASIGVSGAILANIFAKLFDWRMAYYIGGGLGLLLLILRISVFESGMFQQIKNDNVSRGQFFRLFTDRRRFMKYMKCILMGIPLWGVIGILITFSPEISKALHVKGNINAGNAIMFAYAGLVLGDFASGYISQKIGSRRKAVIAFLIITCIFSFIFLVSYNVSEDVFYGITAILGFASGYWAVFVTIAAEQFGTNLRATVATTVPNFVRGSVVVTTSLFLYLKSHTGILESAGIVVGLTLVFAFYAIFTIEETFGKDLNYIEQLS